MPSAIEWTDETWNPVTGCSKISPGCLGANCYAETLSLRFGWSAKPWTPENAAENVVLHPDRLDQPLRWRRPRMVFVNSMSDLFHEQVPDSFIETVFDVMRDAPQHTFQVLTKRPERARDWFRSWSGAPYWVWPLPNVWLGVSIENARHTWRAEVLKEIPAAVRFVSAEPLLGSLFEFGDSQRDREALYERWGSDAGIRRDLTVNVGRAPLVLSPRPAADGTDRMVPGIDWLICGGESGHGHRPMRVEWARELRDACQTASVAFFFKQWGGVTPKSGGRLLDGREWQEFPGGHAA